MVVRKDQRMIVLTHGGVGSRTELSDGPQAAADAGLAVLESGGDEAALRAVIEAASILEDDGRFNAGTGAKMRIDGRVEQDAIVASCDGRIGSVACLESTRYPTQVARLVMDSPHLMLCGQGATSFARERGHFWYDCRNERSIRHHQQSLERLRSGELKTYEEQWRAYPFRGTIGAVARAKDGTFAVSCSTGGTTLMLPGRVGDTPLFGAGVYVGKDGAVCATGDGEEIVRRLISKEAYDRLARGEKAQAICDAMIAEFPEPWVLGLLIVGHDSAGIAATDDKMARGRAETDDWSIEAPIPESGTPVTKSP